ncbi:fused MFS/spermidine synthase [Paludisphaera mucosa]|uniref:Fused MFS/spermidine synthase n=1 Tax=Paludisphaera mucosa TaxID=3030827 RepID=A0ABT6FBL6_9BACT|nr:fused MFS/spermidine synthase [Paludisphaera mucosa]MDG3004983.1 fused MFS/spermidine synthase [Paludisphaera mucosa]
MDTKVRNGLFGAATLGASGLLFAVQPMIGKMLLPAFGGTPGVWNACMLFFQAALLVGYAYVHATSALLGVRGQAVLHGLLSIAALGFLPILIPLDRSPPTAGAWGPGLWVFGLLATTVGPPFVLIAATSPLLQRWYASPGGRDPFVLYAASCAGNLAALAAYPLLIEPLSTLGWQTRAWSAGFGAATTATLLCAVAADRRPVGVAVEEPGGTVGRTSWREFLTWTALASGPVVWLLALTTHLTSELAPMPLLWTIPLGMYLVTYILAFAGVGERWARRLAPTFPWLATALTLVLAAGFVHPPWMPLHLATFFVAALLGHSRLAAIRPEPGRLTTFYLAIGLGGALGSLFCAILAPWLFDRMVEYPLVVFASCMALAWPSGRRLRGELPIPILIFLATWVLTSWPDLRDATAGVLVAMLAAGLGVLAVWESGSRPLRFALTLGAVFLAGGLAPDPGGEVIRRGRNFFGRLRVLYDAKADVRRLMHGSTLHGQQSLAPGLREEPSTYFTRSGPIGEMFAAAGSTLDRPGTRVAVVGLGTGTLACYARPGQAWTFYEIDDAVARVAEDPACFTYLADARRRGASVAVVEGDARLRLADAPDAGFALIVLDAFSSDAVPVHLLSREAVALYRRKLAPGGVLAFNLSTNFLDLDLLMARQALDAGLACRVRHDREVPAAAVEAGKRPSIWALMAESEALPPLPPDWSAPRARPGSSPWTDDYSDLASYLILGRRRSGSFGSVGPAPEPIPDTRKTP